MTMINGFERDENGALLVSGSGGGSGDVASVNGQTGTVVLAAGDVGAAPDDDARLSDQRTPSDLSVTAAKIASALRANMKGVVIHGADPDVPRPTDGFGSYEWIGSVEPTSRVDGDTLTLTGA